jgi:uncharacterized membrane protein
MTAALIQIIGWVVLYLIVATVVRWFFSRNERHKEACVPNGMSVVSVPFVAMGFGLLGELFAQGINYLTITNYFWTHLMFIIAGIVIGTILGIVNYRSDNKYVRLKRKEAEESDCQKQLFEENILSGYRNR